MGGRHPNCDEAEKITPQLAKLRDSFEKEDECSHRAFESEFWWPEPVGVFIGLFFLAAQSGAVSGGGGGAGKFEIQYAPLRLNSNHIPRCSRLAHMDKRQMQLPLCLARSFDRAVMIFFVYFKTLE